MPMCRLALVVALGWLGLGAARAETDWTSTASAWQQQLHARYLVDLARRRCGLPVTKPERAMIGITIGGLEQALYGVRRAEPDVTAWQKEAIASAGGRAGYCKPDSAPLKQAQATLAQVAQSIAQTEPQNVQPPPTPLPATAPTPVVDPDVALIRGCRKAVIAKLGRRSASNEAFWTRYESCISDQGAGWY